MIQLTNRQARQFLLLKQGLLGEHIFIGKQGAFDFVRQAGCIQFDPVDACGKNLSIFPTEDWPYFERYRQAAQNSSIPRANW